MEATAFVVATGSAVAATPPNAILAKTHSPASASQLSSTCVLTGNDPPEAVSGVALYSIAS